jgi:RecA/RadA recombinase
LRPPVDVSLAFTPQELVEPLQRKAQDLVLAALAAGSILASEAVASTPTEALSTSLKSLDDLLQGGFALRQLIEISGTIAKTLLALNTCLRLLLVDSSARALFVDVEATFNAQRAFAVLRQLANADPVTASLLDAELIKNMDRLGPFPLPWSTSLIALATVVSRCNGVREVIKALDDFAADQVGSLPEPCELLMRRLQTHPSCRCIVIDSITPMYKQRMMSSSTQGVSFQLSNFRKTHCRIERQLGRLSTPPADVRAESVLARMCLGTFARALLSLTDLRSQIINGTVKAIPSAPLSAFATCQVKPALGASMSFLTDCTIFLSKAADLLKDSQLRDSPDKVVVAEVWRSRRGPAQSFTVFRTVRIALRTYVSTNGLRRMASTRKTLPRPNLSQFSDCRRLAPEMPFGTSCSVC